MNIEGPKQDDFPALHAAAEATSKASQNLFKRLSAARLGALTGASALGLWVAASNSVLVAIVGALLFLGALLIEAYLWKLRPEQTWYEARAAAESAKTLGWRYAVGGEPFGIESDADVDQLLNSQLMDVLDVLRNIDLAPEIGSGESITSWMRAARGAPLGDRQALYERFRVKDQQTYYKSRGAQHKRDLKKWTRFLFLAEAIGLLGAILWVAGVEQMDVLGLAAAAAASIAAWIQVNQYRALQSAYLVTALELAAVRTGVSRATNEKEWAQFVEEAEKAFSREHTLWKASRGVQSLP